MKIECPNCKASGAINEHELPDEGSYLACPRCKESFHIEKPRKKMTSAFATNTCPSCGYSTFCEEVFDECPHCGMVVQNYIEKKREDDTRKQESELLHKNYSVDAPLSILPALGSTKTILKPGDEKPKVSLAVVTNGFDPVAAVGWGTGIIAVIMLVFGGMGLLYYLGTDIQTQLSEQSVEPVSAWQVFWGHGFLPWLETILGVTLIAASFGFLQRASWGLQAMQRAVSVSLILVPCYELTQYGVWIVKSIAPPWWAYLVEGASAVLVSVLFVVPFFFLYRYLNDHNFEKMYLK